MYELLTPNQMSEADRLTIDGGIHGYDLMNSAGVGVAEAVTEVYAPPKSIAFLTGPGNNGGDGFVAARELFKRGYDVMVGLLQGSDKLSGDAKLAYDDMIAAGIPGMPLSTELISDSDIIVDALFGAGLDRDIGGLAEKVINAANDSNKPIVSIDLPSGISGLTGDVMNVAIRAVLTVTFFRKKIGHLLFPGRKNSGSVKVIDIGIEESVLESVSPDCFRNCWNVWKQKFPIPNHESHKYERGHAVVFSGQLHSTGAARLCAEASLRSGAGLVTVASPSSAVLVNASHLTSVMVRSIDEPDEVAEFLSDERIKSVALGPGFGVGQKLRDFVAVALNGPRSVVLDADALTSFSENPDELFKMIGNSRNAGVVMTPHAGEFKRLFGDLAANRNRIEMTCEAARIANSVIVLKGADTIVASPDGRATVSDNAPPWLATAGSGDVLAGIICGFLAQSVSDFDSANMGVWLHGAAAQRIGPGLVSEDLLPALKPIIRDIVIDKVSN